MPVFNLELKFDDKGALEAVNQMNKVSEAADDATKAMDQLGKNGPKNIDKVTDSAIDASKAIDEFGKNGEESGKKVTDAANNATKAIDNLGQETKQVTNQFNQTSNAVEDVSKSIDDLGKSTGQVASQIDKVSNKVNEATQAVNKFGASGTSSNKELANSAKDAQTSLGNAGKSGKDALGGISKNAELAKRSINLLAKGLQVFAKVGVPASIALGIMGLVSSSKELQEQLQGLEKQYQALGSRAGWTAQEMAGLEKLMIQNGVSAVDARKNVIALTSAYIEASKAPALLAAALDATVISGKSVDDTLRSITQAIESGNTKSLEALGIYTNFNTAYENMAAKIGTTVGALTEQERAQARVDATLEAATANAGLFEAALTDMERAQNAMNESLTELKMEIADAFGFESTDMVNALADAVKWLANVVNSVKTSFSGLGAVIKGELSLAQYFAMDSVQIKEHIKNGLNEDFIKQQLDRVNKVIAERSQNLTPFGDLQLDKAIAARAEYQKQLEKIQKKAQSDQSKANIAERQQQARHNQDMAELQEKSKQNELLRQSKTQEGRKTLAEKGAKDQLAIEKRLYENGLITQEEYKKRSLSIEQDKQIKLNAIEKSYSGKKGGGASKGIGASSKTDAAIKQLENYTRQIDILNGTGSKTAQQLEKVLEGIEATGRAAGLSATEIEKIKTEYAEAFKADALTKFDKELLRVQGNTAALKEIEIAEKMQEWNAQFTALGMSAAEATPKLQAMQAALEDKSNRENIELKLQFYQQLGDLSGDYTESIKYQNKLIDQQAKEWEQAGIPLKDIEERVRRMKRELEKDPFVGIAKGLRNYAEDASNLADQMEDAVTNAFTGMEDAFVNFAKTGELSFKSLADSIIEDLLRIAVKSTITGPLSNAIGGLFSSFLGGGATATAAHGNVFSGGNISGYSNSIVSSPTFFNYDRHITRFAKGAGVMGEAGSEAILPLARMRNGDLGVQYKIETGQNNLQAENMNYLRLVSEMQAQMRSERQYVGDSVPKVNINITNNVADADVQAGEATPDGNGGFNLDIIVAQVEQAMVGRARQGKSPLMRYQESAYGMSRANVLSRGKGRN